MAYSKPNDGLMKIIMPQKNIKKAEEQDKRIQEQNGEQMFKYGMLYKCGAVVPKNTGLALDYFLKAISKGHVGAMAEAGAIYVGLTGDPGYIDRDKGVALLIEAANQGNESAKQYLYFFKKKSQRRIVNP